MQFTGYTIYKKLYFNIYDIITLILGEVLMNEILKLLVKLMAKIHNAIVRYCNISFGGISDKWLHFIIIGLLGMIMIAFIYPLFKELAKKNLIMTISWIYVLTLLVVITFGIEIGQKKPILATWNFVTLQLV